MFYLLTRDDYFGSRMLFSVSQWRKHAREVLKLEENAMLPSSRDAYLSVISDSAVVKVFVLKRAMLEFVPKRVKKSLLTRLKHFEDMDRPFNRERFEAQKAELRRWDMFKGQIASRVLHDRKHRADHC